MTITLELWQSVLIGVWALIMAPLIAHYNGLYLKERILLSHGMITDANKINRLWHKIGWVFRVMVSGIPAILFAPIDILFALMLFINLFVICYPIYDGIINYWIGQKFFYSGSKQSGTGSWWDRNTHKFSLALKIITLVIGTGYNIFYIIYSLN